MEKVSLITVKDLADYLKLDYKSLSKEELEELATFLNVAENFLASYTGLSNEEIDKYNDFVIVIYVLVGDMYDNRSYYIDKNNLNRVVETILNMHSTNYL